MEAYRRIVINGKRVQEHRYIMEQHLGRKLTKVEVVHHINEDKRDNRIENLEIMDARTHMSHHKRGKVKNPNNTGTNKQCPKCKKVLDINGFHGRRSRPSGRQGYCKDCHRKNMALHYARSKKIKHVETPS